MYTTPLSTLISSQSLNHHLYADDTQLYFSFYPPDLHSSISHLSPLQQISSWMTANLLTLNSSKTEFLLIGLKQQLAKIQNSPLSTTHSARNLGFIFDEHLSFSDHITALSKSCNFDICQLCCIRPFLDIKTASTIATSIVHSKLNYCNSLCYNLLKSQLSRLQHIQNSLALAVVKDSKFSHTTPILKFLHWLQVNKCTVIEYKILSLTYKILSTAQPAYLHNLISVQPPGRTHSFINSHHHRSSTLIFLSQNHRLLIPVCISSLWNKLPASFCQLCSSSVTTVTPSITSSLFHSRLKTPVPQILPTIDPFLPTYPLDFNS